MKSYVSDINFEILERNVLKDIPSASGLSVYKQTLFIVGDDSPFLFQLDHQGNQMSKIPIFSTEDFRDQKIIKRLKPDFEALELVNYEGQDELIVFGSGSKSPKRDNFIRIALKDKPVVKTYNLTPFYSRLKKLDIMKGHELNIEAVAQTKDQLLLFNRGKNIIFQFNYKDFIGYLDDKADFPQLLAVEVDLPNINNIKAGLSGATITSNNKTLVFTASVENTSNTYDDGEVLGSFVGVVNLEDIKDPDAFRYILIEEDNQPVKIKVESVSILQETSEHKLDLLLVTDSDGSQSELIKSHLSW